MKEKAAKEPNVEVVSHFAHGSKTLGHVLEEMALRLVRGK